MLYDNALLAATYLHAWVVTGHAPYREVAEETLAHALRELRLPEGGFASSQDADTDGVEGLTFSWTPEQLDEALGPDEGARAAALLGVTPQGSFEHGTSVLRLAPGAELPQALRARLLDVRERRPSRRGTTRSSPAGTACSWRRSRRPAGGSSAQTWSVRRSTWRGSCSARSRTPPAGCTARGARAGGGTGYLDDYAHVAHGLLELHLATGDLRWLREARRLAGLAIELFADDEQGGFFLAPRDGERLVARTKELDDHPTPSGNSMLAHVLLRLGRIYGDDELELRAVSVLRPRRDRMARLPRRSAGRSARSTCTWRRRASSRSSRRPKASWRGRRSRRSIRASSPPTALRTTCPCCWSERNGRRAPGRLRVRTFCLPGSRDRARAAVDAARRAMSTTMTTGAEEIAWDLTDIYSGADDPALEDDLERGRKDAGAFAERYRGQLAELDAAGLLEAVRELDRLEAEQVRIGSFAYLVFSTDTADPAPRRTPAACPGVGGRARDGAPVLPPRVGGARRRSCRRAARRRDARRVRPLPARAPPLPAAPADRAGGADPGREVRLGRGGVEPPFQRAR